MMDKVPEAMSMLWGEGAYRVSIRCEICGCVPRTMRTIVVGAACIETCGSAYCVTRTEKRLPNVQREDENLFFSRQLEHISIKHTHKWISYPRSAAYMDGIA